jgi:hypothetical protein
LLRAIFGQFFIHVDLSCLGFNHGLGENLKLANLIYTHISTLTLREPNLHLPLHDLVVLLLDHFHVKPLEPLQEQHSKSNQKIILKNDESNANK